MWKLLFLPLEHFFFRYGVYRFSVHLRRHLYLSPIESPRICTRRPFRNRIPVVVPYFDFEPEGEVGGVRKLFTRCRQYGSLLISNTPLLRHLRKKALLAPSTISGLKRVLKKKTRMKGCLETSNATHSVRVKGCW